MISVVIIAMRLNMSKSGASQFCTLFDSFRTNLFFLQGDSVFHQEREFEREFEHEFEQNGNLNGNLNRNLNGNFFSDQKHVEQKKVGGFYSTILTPMKLSINRLTNLDRSFRLA